MSVIGGTEIGSVVVAVSGGAGTPSLDQVTNPVATKTFSLGANSLTFAGTLSTSGITLSEAGSGGLTFTDTGGGGISIAEQASGAQILIQNSNASGPGLFKIQEGATGQTGGQLEIFSEGAGASLSVENTDGTGGAGGLLISDASGGGVTIQAATAAGNYIALESQTGGGIELTATGASGGNKGGIQLDTTGTPSIQTNAVSITVPATLGLYMNGTAGVTQTAEAVGTLATKNGIVTTFTAVSDERLKIWAPYDGGLSEVLAIVPIRYRWNEKGQELSGQSGDRDYIGFSAQNTQASIPESIQGITKDGYLSFDDRPVIAALVNAIRELNTKITALENK